MPSVNAFLRDLPASLRRVQLLTGGRRPIALTAGFFSPGAQEMQDTQRLSEYRLLYLLEGRGAYRSGDLEREIHPGDLIQRIPGVTHSIRRLARPRWTDFYLILPPSFYEPLVESGLLPLRGQPALPPDSEVLAKLRALLESFARRENPAECYARVFQTLSLFENRIRTPATEAPLARKMEEARRALEAHPELPGPALAAQLGLGYEHFRKVFRRHFGQSPKEYQIRQKIRRAQEILGAAPLPIGEVSEQLGYPDLFTFSKQFRRVTGMTPSRYRKSVW
ncbi:MAG: helix-turn-helix transcriptional regulator [Spirochaetes bacterium]|nr:helix-turn-helix transcriptional regulator [Spirochaetota bacterium]